MTDHIPNDLSHISDAEFHSLCPQGEHAPGPKPLSLAAQAVLDAFNNRGLSSREWHDGKAASLKLAAALRAVANQVVPPEEERLFNEERPWDGELCAVVEIRRKLLAIADELEGQ
jgi:hypothetical protein